MLYTVVGDARIFSLQMHCYPEFKIVHGNAITLSHTLEPIKEMTIAGDVMAVLEQGGKVGVYRIVMNPLVSFVWIGRIYGALEKALSISWSNKEMILTVVWEDNADALKQENTMSFVRFYGDRPQM